MEALVQLRGEIDMEQGVRDTLSMLNVERVNHCALVPETDTYAGMVTKVNDYVAVGEPSRGVLSTLIERRGDPAAGSDSIDDDWIDSNTDYEDVDSLAGALLAEETTLREQGLSPTLRLHPPRGGHEGLKKPVADGGQIGRHSTEEMDTLLDSMR